MAAKPKTDPRTNVQLREQIAQLEKEGKSIREIAKAVGRSTTRVHTLLHEHDHEKEQ